MPILARRIAPIFLAASSIISVSHADTVISAVAPGYNPPAGLFVESSQTPAQSFTTGAAAFQFQSLTPQLGEFSAGSGFTLAIYSNSGGNLPNTLLYTLTGPSSPANGGNGLLNTYVPASTITLSANTTYWWVASTASGIYDIPVNGAAVTADGFTIGTAALGGSSLPYYLNFVLIGTPSALTVTGSTLQNSAPVSVPTSADFLVIGPVHTAGGDNTIQSLAFASGSSLTIYNNLFVTQGPVNLAAQSSIDLENAALWASQLKVLNGGTLNGNGTIHGDVYNNGLVSPGHSPGEIHVTGNYTQASQGTLKIELAGRKAGQFDVLSVDGSANLDGTLQISRLNGFSLRRGDALRFLSAGEGISGEFATVLDAFATNTILNPQVVYRGRSVSIEVPTFESFAHTYGLTANQTTVARGLDRLGYDHGSESLVQYLDRRDLSKLPGEFDKIAPEELTSLFTIGVSLATVQSQNIQRRTTDIRSGSGGFNAAGLALNGSGPSYSGSFNFNPGVAGPTGGDDKDSKITRNGVAPEESRWGAFLSGTGEWVSVGDTDNARGYDLTSGGFTLGVDYKINRNLAVGLAAGYTGTTADLTDRGRLWVNGGKLGLYATFYQNPETTPAPTMSKDSSKDMSKETPTPVVANGGGWYADVAAFGGYNSYDTRRGGLNGQTRGDTDGGELNALFGTGYDIKKGNLTFGPTATFNYTYLGTSAYAEHGSLAPLDIHGGEAESLRTALGFKVSYDWKIGGLLIRPELRAAWQHEFGDAAYDLTSNFAGASGSSFLVSGPQIGRDSALLGAGIAVQCSERCSTYLYYDGELGRRNYQSSSVTGGFRIEF